MLGYIRSGTDEGAELVCGGTQLTDGALAKGCFVAPTVFANVDPSMRIAREEIFGPVAAILTFRTVEDAIRIANQTSYGLANGVWSSNLDKTIQVIRSLASGTTYVNTYLETIPQLPFGGMKESGLGRENGIEGLREFLETKAAFLRLGQHAGLSHPA